MLVNRTERGLGNCRKSSVRKPDHGNVFRYPVSMFLQGFHGSDGRYVIYGKYAIGDITRMYKVDDSHSGFLKIVGFNNEGWIRINLRILKCLEISLLPV